MAGFEKGKWKAEKLAEFKKALSNSIVGQASLFAKKDKIIQYSI